MGQAPTTPTKQKPIIAVDFDGVIHLYRDGWQSGEIYDGIVPGFFKWIFKTAEDFQIVVVSSRLNEEQQEANMRSWFTHRALEARESGEITQDEFYRFPGLITLSKVKPPAFITIDDRALTFNGNWLSPIYAKEEIWNFKPWNSKPPKSPTEQSEDQ